MIGSSNSPGVDDAPEPDAISSTSDSAPPIETDETSQEAPGHIREAMVSLGTSVRSVLQAVRTTNDILRVRNQIAERTNTSIGTAAGALVGVAAGAATTVLVRQRNGSAPRWSRSPGGIVTAMVLAIAVGAGSGFAITRGGSLSAGSRWRLSVDRATNTAYASLHEGGVARSVERGPFCVVDYDAAGDIIGVEFFGTDQGVDVGQLQDLDRYDELVQKLHDDDIVIWANHDEMGAAPSVGGVAR